MSDIYTYSYLNERNYRKKERILRKINMLGYKKLFFEYYPEIKNGKFLGKIVSKTKEKEEYELELPTDTIFRRVYGVINVHYEVDKNSNDIMFLDITPKEIFEEENEFSFYKGVPVPKENREKNMFKIDLLDMVRK